MKIISPIRIAIAATLGSILFFASQGAAQSKLAIPRTVYGEREKLEANPPRENPQSMRETADRILDHAFEREHELSKEFESFHPIIETYIQMVKPDKTLGYVPDKDKYFLGQADFQGKLKVRSLLEGSLKPDLMWSFNPAGFLQMAFADRDEFDRQHYSFEFRERVFLGEVRCYQFDVKPLPKVRGARFKGRIWVEEQDAYIVRINGDYTPAVHFSWKTYEDEYYLHFDSWRTQVRTGEWLPSYIYSQELRENTRFDVPNFKSATHLWGYKLSGGVGAEEFSRMLLENPNEVKDEGSQHDRSPLEAQREWRHEAERNVLDLLEHNGLLAPAGPVDAVLNTIVNNLLITNNLDAQLTLHCRILLTTNLDMFSVGDTIVISRGLVDAVPDEASLAALLAHGMADAMLPKPYQDQYAFGDIMRLQATEVLRKLSFLETSAEVAENSAKAMELLKKSPYATKLAGAGLFLKQLQSESKQLKHLIEPQLGNQVFFASQLLQTAPELHQDDKSQIAALPMGSRIKVDAWSANVSLMKSKPLPLFSARDKMPFEVTPLVPYLTRYSDTALPTVPPPAPDGSN